MKSGTTHDDATQRLSIEGADPLLLAGVNDVNLMELERATGARVSLRGDTLTLSGTGEQVERAASVAQGLLDLARIGESVSVEDVHRFVLDGVPSDGPLAGGEGKIVLPGLRRAIAPKTPGQKDYVQAIAATDIVVAIGPAGTGKTYLAVAKAVEAMARKRVKRIILARPAVEAGESLGFLPGDLQAKVDPYLRPLYDALEDMMPQERVQKAIATLSPEHRAVVTLHHLEGIPVEEIARMMNCSIGTVKSRLSRARDNLKRKLAGYVEG